MVLWRIKHDIDENGDVIWEWSRRKVTIYLRWRRDVGRKRSQKRFRDVLFRFRLNLLFDSPCFRYRFLWSSFWFCRPDRWFGIGIRFVRNFWSLARRGFVIRTRFYGSPWFNRFGRWFLVGIWFFSRNVNPVRNYPRVFEVRFADFNSAVVFFLVFVGGGLT